MTVRFAKNNSRNWPRDPREDRIGANHPINGCICLMQHTKDNWMIWILVNTFADVICSIYVYIFTEVHWGLKRPMKWSFGILFFSLCFCFGFVYLWSNVILAHVCFILWYSWGKHWPTGLTVCFKAILTWNFKANDFPYHPCKVCSTFWLMLMVNVDEYTIHGLFGFGFWGIHEHHQKSTSALLLTMLRACCTGLSGRPQVQMANIATMWDEKRHFAREPGVNK